MARRAAGSQAILRTLAALALVVLVGFGWGWWWFHHWRPARAAFPSQGVEIGADDGAIDWAALAADGADFVYLDASAGAFAREPGFTDRLEAARTAQLQIGAVHRYDPCQPADPQASNFVSLVPRDGTLLPPAVDLSKLADECPVAVSDAAVESELMTFINQIETHTGRAALLKPSAAFERRYHVAAKFDRNLWLSRDLLQPDYAGRPWTLWTANSALLGPAGTPPLRWIVVQP